MRSNLYLIMFGVFMALFETEIGIRIIDHKLFSTELLSAHYHPAAGKGEEPRAQYDAELGWIPNMGKRHVGSTINTVVDGNVRYNGHPDQYPDDQLILTIGDSFTWGDEVNDNETWPSYLERNVKRKVINAGVFGFGVDQAIMRAQKLVPLYHPKLTILSLIPDDVRRDGMTVRMYPKPYFVLNEKNEPVLRNNPVPLIAPEQSRVSPYSLRGIFGYSYAVDAIMKRIAPNWWLDTPIVLDRQDPIAGFQTDIDKLTCTLIRKRFLPLQTSENKLLIVVQHEKWLSEQDRQIGEAIENCSGAMGIQTYNFHQVLSDAQRNNPDEFKNLYYGHMSPLGNQLIATHIAQLLRERNI